MSISKDMTKPQKEEYAVYFRFNDRNYICAADEEDGSLGHLCNHSRSTVVKGEEGPIVYMYASRYILANEELLWDYNDTNAPPEDRIWLMS